MSGRGGSSWGGFNGSGGRGPSMEVSGEVTVGAVLAASMPAAHGSIPMPVENRAIPAKPGWHG